MASDGSCPTCGRQLGEQTVKTKAPRAPWHFKLLVVALVIYLGWRLIQLIQLLL